MSSYISRIKPNGDEGPEYKLKDEEARSAIQNTNNNVRGSQTTSGNPITITDGSETYAEELSVDLEPVQSGSGTPSPSNIRPIQGYDIVSVDRCGKNLFGDIQYGYTVYQNKITANTDCWMHLFKCEGKTELNVKIFDKGSYGGSFNAICSVDGVNFDSDVILTLQYPSISNGYSTTVSIPSGKKYIAVYGYMSGHGSSHYINTSKVQVSFDSIGDTYEPYNGQNVSLQLGNKNLLPMTVEGIKAANTSGSWSGNVYTNNGITATLLTDKNGCITGIKVNGTSSGQFWLFMSDYSAYSVGSYILNGCPSGGNDNTGYSFIIGSSTTRFGTDTGSGANVTVSSSANLHAAIKVESGTAVSNKVFYPMLRSASVSDPTFSPYNPTLGDMVYGGQLTLNNDGSAVMVVNKVTETYNGSESEGWVTVASSSTTSRYYRKPLVLPAVVTYTEVMLCSHYERKAITSSNTDINVFNVLNAESGTIPAVAIRPDVSVYTTVALYKQYLAAQAQAGTPVQVSYYLLNPFTLHLSAEQLQLLQGTNNVWSNAGDVTLKYQPDNVIAEPKANVQRLRDDVVNTIIRNEYASKNLWDMTGFLKATGWSKISDNSYTGSNVSIHYNNYSAYIQNAHDVLDRTSLYGENFTASFDLKSANSDAPSLYLGFVITNTNGVERYIDTGNIITNRHVELTTNCSKDERVTGIYFSRAYDRTIVISNFQLERGSSPTAYEEYYPSNRELWEMIKALQNI